MKIQESFLSSFPFFHLLLQYKYDIDEMGKIIMNSRNKNKVRSGVNLVRRKQVRGTSFHSYQL